MSLRSILCGFIVLISNVVTAQITVNTIPDLYAAIDTASAGTTIELVDGTYSGDNIFLDIQALGTLQAPIIIRAESKGGVRFTGVGTKVRMGGAYIFLQGFQFIIPEGDSTRTVIDLSNNTDCEHCKIFNVTLKDTLNTMDTDTITWINVRGSHNEIAHCSFLDKTTVGSIIRVGRVQSKTDYHLIHHNYFSGREQVFNAQGNLFNGQDAIRIGDSGSAGSTSSCAVFNNYFYDYKGEIEIIANKAGNNRYYNNTFRANFGLLSLRHGDNCEVYSNYFLGENVQKSGGVRLVGSGHKVYNNYMSDLDHQGSAVVGPISITRGDPNASSSGYQLVNSASIFNNTIVDCDIGIRIGTQDATSLTGSPMNVDIYNNVLINTVDAIEVMNSSTSSCQLSNNMREGGNWDLSTCSESNNVVEVNILEASLTELDLIFTGSPAVDFAIPIPGIEFNFDLTNGVRSGVFDAGAEELGSMGNHLPYTSNNYASLVGAASGGIFHCYNEDIIIDIPIIVQKDYESKKRIIATGEIESANDVLFSAGEGVLLLPGFCTGSSESFEAVINVCSN